MRLLIVLVALVVTNCASMRAEWKDEVHTRAAFDLQCPGDQVTVETLSNGSMNSGPVFGARGCGRRATYIADTRNGVQMNSPVSNDAPETAKPAASAE